MVPPPPFVSILCQKGPGNVGWLRRWSIPTSGWPYRHFHNKSFPPPSATRSSCFIHTYVHARMYGVYEYIHRGRRIVFVSTPRRNITAEWRCFLIPCTRIGMSSCKLPDVRVLSVQKKKKKYERNDKITTALSLHCTRMCFYLVERLSVGGGIVPVV